MHSWGDYCSTYVHNLNIKFKHLASNIKVFPPQNLCNLATTYKSIYNSPLTGYSSRGEYSPR